MSRAGSVFFVTGGASGLGEATVRKLVAEGASVMIVDRNEELGEAMCKELGAQVAFAKVDITDEKNVEAAIKDTVAKFGRLDGVVNCAGIGSASLTFSEKRGGHPTGIFDIVQKINLYGTFYCCKHGAAAMSKNEADESGLRGVLINVASVAAFEGQKGQVAYAASKGAVASMSLPMARDLSRIGVRVVCIAPGTMETPMMKMASQKVRDNLLRSVVAPKRMGTPEEFASLVTTIVDTRYLNATTIRLDGGVRMANL